MEEQQIRRKKLDDCDKQKLNFVLKKVSSTKTYHSMKMVQKLKKARRSVKKQKHSVQQELLRLFSLFFSSFDSRSLLIDSTTSSLYMKSFISTRSSSPYNTSPRYSSHSLILLSQNPRTSLYDLLLSMIFFALLAIIFFALFATIFFALFATIFFALSTFIPYCYLYVALLSFCTQMIYDMQNLNRKTLIKSQRINRA